MRFGFNFGLLGSGGSRITYTNCWNTLIQLPDGWYGYDFAQTPTGNMTPLITSEGKQIYANKFDAVSGDFILSFGVAGNEKAGDATEAAISFNNNIHVILVWSEVNLRYEGNDLASTEELVLLVDTEVCFEALVIPHLLIDYDFGTLETT